MIYEGLRIYDLATSVGEASSVMMICAGCTRGLATSRCILRNHRNLLEATYGRLAVDPYLWKPCPTDAMIRSIGSPIEGGWLVAGNTGYSHQHCREYHQGDPTTARYWVSSSTQVQNDWSVLFNGSRCPMLWVATAQRCVHVPPLWHMLNTKVKGFDS